MTQIATKTFSRGLFALLCAFVLLFGSSTAAAAGRVQWKSNSFKERTKNQSWRLELNIYLPRPPDVAWVPFKFEFEPTASYERELIDNHEGPIERTVPLTGQQSLIESVDVGFMDPGTGKIQTRTKFTFKLTRAQGYRAGEYKVTIRDTRNGQMVGTPTKIKLTGENEIVDRRSINFVGGSSKKKKKDPAKTEEENSSEESTEAESADEPESSGDDMPEADYEDEGAVPPSIEEKPGGCGCHHGPSHGEHWMVLLAGVLLGGFLLRRRFSA